MDEMDGMDAQCDFKGGTRITDAPCGAKGNRENEERPKDRTTYRGDAPCGAKGEGGASGIWGERRAQ